MRRIAGGRSDNSDATVFWELRLATSQTFHCGVFLITSMVRNWEEASLVSEELG